MAEVPTQEAVTTEPVRPELQERLNQENAMLREVQKDAIIQHLQSRLTQLQVYILQLEDQLQNQEEPDVRESEHAD